ncbi:uncharacterized protein LOC115629605 [Scaptodrosophila lebanonensis]|uniref:Uncharacterized protein LOC115629605 n=1 Tax=Drosophila lebanonensis TaxID=7225 RepID=A0A6J2TZP9_DROLE|nr:uncharacterized protein LOC115629605 [Scaptodrosophila lebanonensis]
MVSDADVAEVRHVMQRILVPCVFVIGLLGNSVSIYVLTRKRMRCTTNIYLTALAITDIAYLTFQLILSLKHYDYIKYHLELYWMLYGTFLWLCDACAYISIYIAVCFTIERFIAIRYPLKRQTFCTESLAKKVIGAVTLFCLLSTVSTAFEHTYSISAKLIDSEYRPCNLTAANVLPASGPGTSDTSATPSTTTTTTMQLWPELLERWGSGDDDDDEAATLADNIPSIVTPRTRLKPATAVGGTPVASLEQSAMQTWATQLSREQDRKSWARTNGNNSRVLAFNVTEYCQNVTFYTNAYSQLGQNTLYINIWSMATLLVFVLLPLSMLATFNCFLIMLVHRSKSLRGDLTNASSMRRTKRKSNSGLAGSVSQENRVTITLIAVVLLFIVCQLPWAIYLILVQYMEIEWNIQLVAGNVFNFLAAINAAANFFLYCVLSDKYRKTVRELITGYRYRHRHARNNTSIYTPHTTTTLTHINGDGGYGGAGSRRSRGKAAGTTGQARLIS